MKLEGVFPAIATPFNKNGEIDLTIFSALLDAQWNAGVDGVFVGGTGGEGMMLTEAERQALLSHAMSQLPKGKKVIVHVSAFHPEDSFPLIHQANDLGVDAIAILPPGYYSPLDDEEVYQYYEWLSVESDVPVMIYHLPGYSHFTISPELLNRLFDLPKLAGIKDSSGNVINIYKAIQHPSNPIVLNGSDETILTSLANGASGLISCPANIMPDQFAKLYQAHKNGDFEQAQKIQRWINLVLCQLLKHPLVPAVKQVLCWQGFEVGPARRPSRSLTNEEQHLLRNDLETIGFELLSK